MTKSKPWIGFIGQGFIGKNLADNFENRGYRTARFSLESKYKNNRELIQQCSIVFVAVPTPTTPKGFDYSIIDEVLHIPKEGTIVVIKSTVAPGTTEKLQKKYKKLILIHSPEFLSEATAREDTDRPFANIIGAGANTPLHKNAAKRVLEVLPKAPYFSITTSKESEIIKYSHNCSGYVQVVFFNVLYDLAKKRGADWEIIQSFLKADPFISNKYSNPVHKSGRGAGGHCFIKDFAAFIETFKKVTPSDKLSIQMLRSIEAKNKDLLHSSGKDLNLLAGVYGQRYLRKNKK